MKTNFEKVVEFLKILVDLRKQGIRFSDENLIPAFINEAINHYNLEFPPPPQQQEQGENQKEFQAESEPEIIEPEGE